jgi:hypothetical protein
MWRTGPPSLARQFSQRRLPRSGHRLLHPVTRGQIPMAGGHVQLQRRRPWMGLAGPWMGLASLSTGFTLFLFFMFDLRRPRGGFFARLQKWKANASIKFIVVVKASVTMVQMVQKERQGLDKHRRCHVTMVAYQDICLMPLHGSYCWENNIVLDFQAGNKPAKTLIPIYTLRLWKKNHGWESIKKLRINGFTTSHRSTPKLRFMWFCELTGT